QEHGLLVRLADKVLPLRPRREVDREQETQHTAALRALERAVDGAERLSVIPEVEACESTRWQTWAQLRSASAEVRMRQAYAALEEAELRGAPTKDIERCEREYARAVDAARCAEMRVREVSLSGTTSC